jgi:hypothetical protein
VTVAIARFRPSVPPSPSPNDHMLPSVLPSSAPSECEPKRHRGIR